MKTFAIALVTAPGLVTARKLARAALTARLAACVNIVPWVESHYWWKGGQKKNVEVLLLFKTTASRLPALEKLIVAQHPYDTPEFVALPVTRGNKRYLQWLSQAVA